MQISCKVTVRDIQISEEILLAISWFGHDVLRYEVVVKGNEGLESRSPSLSALGPSFVTVSSRDQVESIRSN